MPAILFGLNVATERGRYIRQMSLQSTRHSHLIPDRGHRIKVALVVFHTLSRDKQNLRLLPYHEPCQVYKAGCHHAQIMVDPCSPWWHTQVSLADPYGIKSGKLRNCGALACYLTEMFWGIISCSWPIWATRCLFWVHSIDISYIFNICDVI